MAIPLYRPSLDFNALPVPPHYVPGSLRGDKGFRTSAEKLFSTPISFCESELKTLKDLSLLHAPSDSRTKGIQEDEQTLHVKEPKRKYKQHSAMMPSVYDFSHTQRFESLANKDTYLCYTTHSGESVAPTSYSSQEKSYVQEVAELELECRRDPAITSLWIRLISVHYRMGNLKLAAAAALDMFSNIDYPCSYQKLWDLLLSDDSIAMKAILEYYDIPSINNIFKLILMNIDACIPFDDSTNQEGRTCALIDCKHMVLCANIFCALFLSSLDDPDTEQLLRTTYNSLVTGLLHYHTHNFIYFLAIVEILYLRIHNPTLYYNNDADLQSYKDLVNYNYKMSEKMIMEDSQSNIFLGAYILAESIILQDSKHIVAIARHAVNGAFKCSITTSMHSKQLERLVCGIGSFSSPIISTRINSSNSIEKSLILLQKLMCKDSSVHNTVKHLINNETGTINLTSINRALKNASAEDEDEILLLFHIGRLGCLSILTNMKKSNVQEMNGSDLKELLICIEYINKENASPELVEYLLKNGVKLYYQNITKMEIDSFNRLEIGLLLLSICKSAELAETLFRTYKQIIKRGQNRCHKKGSYLCRLNTFPRIESMILYAQKDDLKEAIVDCANGHGSLYQGALKEAILTSARHVFPYTTKFIDKLLITANTCNWLQSKISSLLHGAKHLLSNSKDASKAEIATYLHSYAVSILMPNMPISSVQFNCIIETLEILMLPSADGVMRFKKCTEAYAQTPWAAALMSIFITEHNKAAIYWDRWLEHLQQSRHSVGSIDSSAESAFRNILADCNSIMFSQEQPINRDNVVFCLLNVISVFLFYSYKLN